MTYPSSVFWFPGQRFNSLLRLTLWAMLILVSAAAHLTQAQTTSSLSGQITDQQSRTLPQAKLTLYARANGSQLTTQTDEQGAFGFARLTPGEYLLTIEAPGFARTVRQVRLVALFVKINIALSAASLHDEVVITATNTPQSIDEVAKSVNSIPVSEIEARNEYSLAESLRLTPGLRVQQLGGPNAFTAIKTRGLRNEDTAILIDGFRFRDASSIAGDALSFISDLLIVNPHSVEVLRGSGSSLYGTNAIGGVINLVTDEGGGAPHGQVQIEGGGLGFLRGRGTLAGGTRENRLVYSLGLAHLNVARGLDRQDEARNTGGQGFAKWQFAPGVSLSGRLAAHSINNRLNDNPFDAPGAALPATGVVNAVALSLAQQRRLEAGLPVTPSSATFVPDLNDPDYRRHARYFSGALRLDHALHSRFSYQLSYHNLLTSRSFRDGPLGMRFEPEFSNLSRYDARIDTAAARFDWLASRFNQLTGGYEFEREIFDNPSSDENPNPTARVVARTKVQQRSHAVFAQDQLRLWQERLQISLALRAQFFQLVRPEFFGGAPSYTNAAFPAPPNAYTGDAAVAYFIRSSQTKLRAHVGNGYRAPSLYERFGTGFFGGSFSPYGDPRLRPDRSLAVDGGVDQTFGRNRVKASATYFYTRLQEISTFDFSGLINPTTDPYGRFGGYRNTGGGLARGVELSFQAKPTLTTELQASYTYTNADQRVPSSVVGFLPSFGISAQQFSALLNQGLTRRLDATFELFAAGDYFFAIGFPARAYRFAGPVKGDFGLRYALPLTDKTSLRLYGKVDNVFNRVYFENGFRTPGAQFIGGASYQF